MEDVTKNQADNTNNEEQFAKQLSSDEKNEVLLAYEESEDENNLVKASSIFKGLQ